MHQKLCSKVSEKEACACCVSMKHDANEGDEDNDADVDVRCRRGTGGREGGEGEEEGGGRTIGSVGVTLRAFIRAYRMEPALQIGRISTSRGSAVVRPACTPTAKHTTAKHTTANNKYHISMHTSPHVCTSAYMGKV